MFHPFAPQSAKPFRTKSMASDDDYLETEEIIMSVNTAIRLLQAGRIHKAVEILLELNLALEQDYAAELLTIAEENGEPYGLH